MRNPAAVPGIGLLAGSVAGALIPVPPTAAAALLIAAWLAAVTACAFQLRKAVIVTAAAGFFLSGVVMAGDAHAQLLNSALRHLFVTRLNATNVPEPVVVAGWLTDDASLTEYGASLDVRVERVAIDGVLTPVRGRIRVAVNGSLVADVVDRWRAGRGVRMPVTLRRPQPYLNPGITDQELALARRGIELLGSVKSGALVEVVERAGPIEEGAGAVRAWVRRVIVRHVGVWSAQTAGIATAILIGDRAGLSPELEDRLRRAGTYHVIAISGGNIAILAAALLVLARVAGASPRSTAGSVITVVVAYGFVVMGGQSVTRATVAAVIYFAAQLLDHRGAGLNLLLITAAIAIIWEPLAALDVGFALTFGATFGILVAAPRSAASIGRTLAMAGVAPAVRRWFDPAVALFAATIAAELMLFPIGAWTFSAATFAGLILNFLAIPLMSVVQIAAIVTVLLSPLPWAGWPAAVITHFAALGLVESTRLLDWTPWLAWRVPPPAVPVLLLYYVACGVVLAGTRVLVRFIGSLAMSVAAVSMLSVPLSLAVTDMLPEAAPGFQFDTNVKPESSLRVTFLDVAQGDATLVQFPGRRTLLIDAGGVPGSFDIGSRVVGPALWALGISQLDFVLLTHAHPDHAGGLPAVIRDFRPGEVWEGIPVPPYGLLQLVRRSADMAGASWRPRLAGDFLSIGGVSVRVLHPPPADWERQDVRNDDSVVVELRWRDVSVILPGDIGRDVEARMIPRVAPARLRVIKAAHHGSRTSSSPLFVHTLRPTAVVFSAGRGNFYRHPAPDIVRRYRRVHAEVFRTDQDGAIQLETDGHWLTFETITGRRVRF